MRDERKRKGEREGKNKKEIDDIEREMRREKLQ
jgi:hypothetical protein